MASLIIALFFYGVGIWLIFKDTHKPPHQRRPLTSFAAALAVFLAVSFTLMFFMGT